MTSAKSIDALLGEATDAVNAAAPNSEDECRANSYRRGIIDAAGVLGCNVGRLLMGQDERQFAAGHEDREMCGGVWLDKEAA